MKGRYKYSAWAVLCLLLAALTTNAQKDSSTTRTITFENYEVAAKPIVQKVYKKNAVGIGMLTWVQGFIPIYYERNITRFFSLRLGAGFTCRSYTSDIAMARIWYDGNFSGRYNGTNDEYDIYDHYANYSFRKATLGYYLGVMAKMYPKKKGMQGMYVAPAFEYKHFAYRAKLARTDLAITSYGDGDLNVPRSDEYLKEYNRCVDVTFNIGGLYQLHKHVSLDWRLGFGVRQHFSYRLDIGATQTNYLNNGREYNKIKPVLVADLVVCGLF